RDADDQKRQAQLAFGVADRKAAAEEAAKDEALRAQHELRRNLYHQTIAVAYHEWKNGSPRRAEQLIDECASEFRDWEWRYLLRLCHNDLLTLHAPDLLNDVDLS